MLVCLDPGHGGSDPGATYGTLYEKTLTLALALALGRRLVDTYSVDVMYTRQDDRFVGLSERARIANDARANFFLSIHINAGGGEGYEDYIYPGTEKGSTGRIRDVLHDYIAHFLQKLGVADRGKKEADFAVLRETVMDAVLLEVLFIDSAKDRALLVSPEFQDQFAAAAAAGLADALQLPLRGTPTPAPTPAPTSSPGPEVLYRVQVGAFHDRQRADALAAELRQKGYPAIVLPESAAGH
ncbi:N-acetylmuramoyl-L-alanine amidase [Kyrpidia spormannii]|uniref:N-acetylmuramoyl-L-alanine amidase n=1 Tax=Kyrpidia spormannii TaxID=2055160 RepID=A0A2K8N7N1_9BACL|nr:N-acetylmuramoyl-L-alanine amidase [Kyrpidia spormannii]ATY85351.1 N-acetylmuramoyl-L-alanine amidase [Kyrpidia spormannii]